MITGLIHPGSGLGDQLFTYITTRTIAENKGYDFGFVGKEYFKGNFIDLDWGKDSNLSYDIEESTGRLLVREWQPELNCEKNKEFIFNKPYYDPEVNFIEDGMIIDATGAQDERYWDIDKVREWLKTEVIEMPSELCVINFRGGEYATVPSLFLNKEYWDTVIKTLVDKYDSKISFEVHTDDVELATRFFPRYFIHKDIELNWRSVRYAKHLILSNSAFGIIPALLNENVKEVIAPKGWANRNAMDGTWERPQNYYSKFTYV